MHYKGLSRIVHIPLTQLSLSLLSLSHRNKPSYSCLELPAVAAMLTMMTPAQVLLMSYDHSPAQSDGEDLLCSCSQGTPASKTSLEGRRAAY